MPSLLCYVNLKSHPCKSIARKLFDFYFPPAFLTDWLCVILSWFFYECLYKNYLNFGRKLGNRSYKVLKIEWGLIKTWKTILIKKSFSVQGPKMKANRIYKFISKWVLKIHHFAGFSLLWGEGGVVGDSPLSPVKNSIIFPHLENSPPFPVDFPPKVWFPPYQVITQ